MDKYKEPSRRHRIRGLLLATIVFIAYNAAITWVYVHKANVDLSKPGTLTRGELTYAGGLIALYGIGFMMYAIRLSRIR